MARFSLCLSASDGGAEASTVVILSLFCLIAGVTLAGVAPKRPIYQATLERTGGGLIVIGLVIVGAGLPLFR